MLARSGSPLPDTFHGVTDPETRYRKRHLDLLMNEETRELFLLRARVVSAIRRYLDAEGFVEVETPILQSRYGGAFARPLDPLRGARRRPLPADRHELYLKRLIVGGLLERVYEIGKDFRNESVSYKHQPEPTMLEWYEAYADYEDTMACVALVEQVALEALGDDTGHLRGREIDLKAPWARVRFTDALEAHELWTRDEAEPGPRSTHAASTPARQGLPQPVDHAFSHFVEPVFLEPTIVHDYPIELSPFARLTDGDPTLTERFEYSRRHGARTRSPRSTTRRSSRRARRPVRPRRGGAGDPDYVEALSYGMPPTGGLARHRPPDAARRARDDPRRDPVPGAPSAMTANVSPGRRALTTSST